MLAHAASLSTSLRATGRQASPDRRNSDRLFAFGSKEKTYRPDEQIYREEDSADHIYRMIRGTVRGYKLLNNGGRKIEAFRIRGDIFGLETGDRRDCCAEAIDNVRVMVARRSPVVGAPSDSDTVSELWAATMKELHRVRLHALWLAKNSEQRIAGFLLEISRRLGEPNIVYLPMSRQDIADYLGVTIETVSRALTQFETKGILRRPGPRQIALLDRIALHRMND